MKLSLIALFVAAFMIGCSSNTTAPEDQEPQLKSIGEVTDNGVTVEVLADADLSVGYNSVFVKVTDNGSAVTNAMVMLHPMMDMGMMTHSTPVEQPEAQANSKGMFEGAIIFMMAGTPDQWTVEVMYNGNTYSIPVNVLANSSVKVLKDGMKRTVVTLVTKEWRVGMNDIKFMVHKSMDGHVFTTVDNATLSMTPSMPSMGHGSNGNVDPVSMGDGWYEGDVNLTMTGDWDIELKHVENDADMFTVNFQIIVN